MSGPIDTIDIGEVLSEPLPLAIIVLGYVFALWALLLKTLKHRRAVVAERRILEAPTQP